MGYDMNVVDKDGKDVDCENNYWRRALGGGYRQAEILVRLGMAHWPAEGHEQGPFPQRSDYEGSDDFDWDTDNPDYDAVLFPYLKDRRGAGTGISAYKLCDTNDGWWVTREECTEALVAWEAAGKPDVDDFGSGALGDTIPFLQAAAEHSGFRVY